MSEDSIWIRIGRQIQRVDLFAKPITFTHMGSETFKTVIGGTCSLLLLVVLLLYTIYLSLVNASVVDLGVQRLDIKQTLPVSLTDEIPHAITPFEKGFTIAVRHFIEVGENDTQIEFWLYTQQPNNQGARVALIESGPCTKDDVPEEYYDKLKYHKCIKNKHVNLYTGSKKKDDAKDKSLLYIYLKR